MANLGDQIDALLLKLTNDVIDETLQLSSGAATPVKPILSNARQTIESLITQAQTEARIDELLKWRTMIVRMADYMDGKESLSEYDDRLAQLRKDSDETR